MMDTPGKAGHSQSAQGHLKTLLLQSTVLIKEDVSENK